MKLAKEKGSSLLEVVVVSAILALVSVAFLGTISIVSTFHQKDMLVIKGELLAEEGIEALRFIKSSSWISLSSIPSGSTRYLALATSSWSVSNTPEVIDGVFNRSFKVTEVRRDSGDAIVASGGTVDPNTLLLEVTVTWVWRTNLVVSSYKTYITNL